MAPKRKKKHRSGKKTQRQAKNTQALLHQALTLHHTGKLDHAGEIYQSILRKEPNNPDALNLSGLIALDLQDLDTAKKLINKAIHQCPQMASFHFNLGRVLATGEDFQQAIQSLTRAVHLKPDYFEALIELANTHRHIGQNQEALEYYKQANKLQPNQVITLHNMANTQRDLGQYEDALTQYEKALHINPNLAMIYLNIGNTYRELNNVDKALEYFQKAIDLDPEYADPLNNIGYLLQTVGKLYKALPYLKQALNLKPNSSPILHNIGNVYKDMGLFTEAIDQYQKALSLTPKFPSVHSNILFAMNYSPEFTPETMYHEACNWWVQQAAHLLNKKTTHPNIPDPNRKLRLGFISPDFIKHSVSFFFLPLIKELDPNKVELFCYSDVARPDQFTAEIKTHCQHWRQTLGVSDATVAQTVREDEIDILIELTGHTANNRLLALAEKPAPVQVSWLGYPNTTGVATIDYRLTDSTADPEGLTDPFYSEKLFRLPHTFLCYQPPAEAPEIDKITKDHITFGSFNNPTKMSTNCIQVWAKILQQVPGSQLVLKGTTLRDDFCRKELLQKFATQEIGAERIVIEEYTTTLTEHLSLYNKIDIGLDPFPYNGTTTTCEALWMGVPVVTLTGEVHCARVGTSILSQLEQAELIANSEEDYIKKAVELSQNKAYIKKFQTSIRTTMQDSPLCNAPLFAEDFEHALKTMWQKWCLEPQQGKPVKHSLTHQAKIRKLHIGGTEPSKGWEIINALQGDHVDHVGNANDLSQFTDNTFVEIYASHVLEHFDYKDELHKTLQEWRRVLTPSGKIHISVPDMDILSKLFLAKENLSIDDRFLVMRMMFGGHVDEYDYHAVGLNEEFLSSFLSTAGFINIQRVQAFNLFNDTSNLLFKEIPVSLNMIAEKPPCPLNK